MDEEDKELYVPREQMPGELQEGSGDTVFVKWHFLTHLKLLANHLPKDMSW